MQSALSTECKTSRVRCVFDDAVISFDLGDRPTLGDIALMLNESTLSRHGRPLAIDIAWPDRQGAGRQMTS